MMPSLLLDGGADKGERTGRRTGVDDRHQHVVIAGDRTGIQLVPGQRQFRKDDNPRLRRTHDTRVRLGVAGNVSRTAGRLSRNDRQRGCTHPDIIDHARPCGGERRPSRAEPPAGTPRSPTPGSLRTCTGKWRGSRSAMWPTPARRSCPVADPPPVAGPPDEVAGHCSSRLGRDTGRHVIRPRAVALRLLGRRWPRRSGQRATAGSPSRLRRWTSTSSSGWTPRRWPV